MRPLRSAPGFGHALRDTLHVRDRANRRSPGPSGLEVCGREAAPGDGRDGPARGAKGAAVKDEDHRVSPVIDTDRGCHFAGSLELDRRAVEEEGAYVIGREAYGHVLAEELEPAIIGAHRDECDAVPCLFHPASPGSERAIEGRLHGRPHAVL